MQKLMNHNMASNIVVMGHILPLIVSNSYFQTEEDIQENLS